MSNYGKTWWGQQWLQSLANIDYSNRLPRGSAYAKKGAVTKLEIKNNQVEAKVKGSRPKPYSVNVIVPPFFNPELERFLQTLAQKPVIISKLLNRELDPSLLEIAEQHGLKVFPRQWSDFKMQCNCPDWAVPCKHLAAVIYKVSAEIDNNPFLAFTLHNVDLLKELEKFNVFVDKANMEVPQLSDLYFAKTKQKKIFNEDDAYAKLHFNKLSSVYEPLTALLTDNPVFYQGGGNFKEKYKVVLGKIVKQAQRIIQGKTALSQFFEDQAEDKYHIQHRSQNTVEVSNEHQVKVYINTDDLSITDFISRLSQIHTSQTTDYQPSVAALHSTFYFALHLIANGAIVPQIVQLGNKEYKIFWQPAVISKEVNELVQQLEQMLPPGLFVFVNKNKQQIINNNTAYHLLSVFITGMIGVFAGSSYNDDVFLQLFFNRANYSFKKPGEEALAGGIMSWLQKYFITQGKYKPQIVVSELPNDDFELSFNVFEKNTKGLAVPISLQQILNQKQYEKIRFEILQSFSQLSSFISGMDAHINANAEKRLLMQNSEFAHFLFNIIPAIQLLNIDVLLPKALQHLLKPKASIKVKAREKAKSYLNLNSLLAFDWQIAVGDDVISEEEFRKILKKSDGLIKYKNNYIYVNKTDLEKLHRHFTDSKELTPYELLRAVLSGEYNGSKIAFTDEIKQMINELTQFSEVPLPANLNATLRPYQVRGYSWLFRNSKIGFGSVIADDMGLGKTLQVITTLLKYKEEGLLNDAKILVVAPTGLLYNWQKEIEKFAPSLLVKIYHGTGRKFEKKEQFDVVISSYGVVRSDAGQLKKMKWHSLVIDEAQNIKNLNTDQTKAVKSIPANNFIAMSGTPVENKLSELWSIMDYSNRGFLGTIKEFNESYGNPIQVYNDEQVAGKLKKITSPFLMRRLKSDKSIISDLPDKIEMDSFAALTKEQAALYEKTLQEALKEIEGIKGNDSKTLFVRQGLVLQMILALKQICNHPTQFLKNNILDDSLSGKMNLLYDKLDSIVESGEKALIFSQFTEMGLLLKHFLEKRYNETPLFYHGGCSVKERNYMVDAFQHNRAEKIFLLSLKAAGTGLNLTAANHVIHYDLWWNPAVEAQATDRAYRIGQKNNVMVHRLITKDTFEEKINEMIQGKKSLANMTVATGENWIGNLSNTDLRNMFEIKS